MPKLTVFVVNFAMCATFTLQFLIVYFRAQGFSPPCEVFFSHYTENYRKNVPSVEQYVCNNMYGF
jgi:hypothetical protein